MISISVFNIIGVAVLGVMIAFWYTPIQKPKRYLINLLPSHVNFIGEVFSCSKCSSFILGIILFQNIFIAALCAFIGFVINFLIDYINEWYARD
jgi:hypothetical protein